MSGLKDAGLIYAWVSALCPWVALINLFEMYSKEKHSLNQSDESVILLPLSQHIGIIVSCCFQLLICIGLQCWWFNVYYWPC